MTQASHGHRSTSPDTNNDWRISCRENAIDDALLFGRGAVQSIYTALDYRGRAAVTLTYWPDLGGTGGIDDVRHSVDALAAQLHRVIEDAAERARTSWAGLAR